MAIRGASNGAYQPILRLATRWLQQLPMNCAGHTRPTIRRPYEIGNLRQDASIPAMIQVDELLGKHFAILGSTGTGKSCGVAMILRAILQENPHAHMLLLDPHNEYASSFGDMAEVITPRDLQLPFWFLTFEEMVEVVIGDPTGKDAMVEILAELIPQAKSRYAANRGRDNAVQLKKGHRPDQTAITVDTPVPYRISDLLALMEDRVGRIETPEGRDTSIGNSRRGSKRFPGTPAMPSCSAV